VSIETLLLLLFFVGLPLLERLNQWSRERAKRETEARNRMAQGRAESDITATPEAPRAPRPTPPARPDGPREPRPARPRQAAPVGQPERAGARPRRPAARPETMRVPGPERPGAMMRPADVEARPAFQAVPSPPAPAIPPPAGSPGLRSTRRRPVLAGLASRSQLRQSIALMAVLGPCRAESPYE